jgi:hypothetical protein
MREIQTEARKHHVSVTETMNAYFEAYHTHKAKHGSFKNIHEPHYVTKMHERYRFMRQTALEFIAAQATRK